MEHRGTFGRFVTQGCRKECPVDWKKTQSALCSRRGSQEDRAFNRHVTSIRERSASRRTRASRTKRLRIR